MKRLAHLLIRLYPHEWRTRYGEECLALIDDSPERLSTIFDLAKGMIQMQAAVRNFSRPALALSTAGLIAGLVLSYQVTPRYTSMVELRIIDAGDGSTAAAHFTELRDEVMSRTTLSWIIQDPGLDLYRRERVKEPLEDVIETMRTRDVRVFLVDHAEGPKQSYAGFRIQCTFPGSHLAQQITRTLVTKLLETNEWQQRNRADNTQGADEVPELEARIAVLEQRLGIARNAASLSRQARFGETVRVETIDPPNLPIHPEFPDRAVFMAVGFGAGFLLAVAIAALRRPLPFLPPELA